MENPQLLAITYSEFDNIVGPRLVYQYPPNVMTQDTFDSVSDYVIVGNHLCGKLICVKLDDQQYINYSVAIENPKVCIYVLYAFLSFITQCLVF